MILDVSYKIAMHAMTTIATENTNPSVNPNNTIAKRHKVVMLFAWCFPWFWINAILKTDNIYQIISRF